MVSMISLAKTHNLGLTTRKHQANPNEVTLYRTKRLTCNLHTHCSYESQGIQQLNAMLDLFAINDISGTTDKLEFTVVFLQLFCTFKIILK